MAPEGAISVLRGALSSGSATRRQENCSTGMQRPPALAARESDRVQWGSVGVTRLLRLPEMLRPSLQL